MIILGSGTKLERTDSDDSQWSIPANTLTIESISNTGVSTAIPWQKNINFAATPFYITEMNIITLGETDSIKIIGWSSKYMPRIMDGQTISEYAFNRNGYTYISDNEGLNVEDGFSMCDGSIIYTVNGTSTTLPSLTNFYEIKSRLDLNVGPGIEQQLITSVDAESEEIISSQRVVFDVNGSDVVVSAENRPNCYIQASNNCVNIGNIINLSQLTNFFSYTKDETSYARGVKITNEITEPIKYPFYCEDISSKEYIVPIHMIGSEVPVTVWFEATGPSGSPSYSSSQIQISDYNATSPAQNIILNGNTSYYLKPTAVQGVPNTLELYLCIQ